MHSASPVQQQIYVGGKLAEKLPPVPQDSTKSCTPVQHYKINVHTRVGLS